jgi:hypothetical protein
MLNTQTADGQVRVMGPVLRVVGLVAVGCLVLVAVALFLDHRAGRGTYRTTLTVVRPDQLDNESAGPAFLPANITLPANATVTVTVYDFDGSTALPAQYGRAAGISGPMTIQALNDKDPNRSGPARSVVALDAKTQVGHTFTIPSLGLNVPIAGNAKVTFTFHTPKRGVYMWRCMDPCGSGPAGWSGAMADNGWMQGSIQFT